MSDFFSLIPILIIAAVLAALLFFHHAAGKNGNRRIRTLTAILTAVFSVILLFLLLLRNPRVSILISTLRFAEETLDNPSYIAYQVDLQELCGDYLNGDTVLTGNVLIDHSRNIRTSTSMEVSGERSFTQRKAACSGDLSVLVLPLGEFDFYAEGSMLYMVVPMLNNLSYAFDAGIDLFLPAPELTSDLDITWFRENRQNILTFVGDIRIEKNGDVLKDCRRFSTGYRITIPEGSGGFIWELLGIEAPQHDVVVDLYLTPDCRVRRVVMDLSEVLHESAIESAVLTIDGTDCGTAILSLTLPDGESATLTAVKNGDILSMNLLDMEAVYHVNNGDLYTATGSLVWDRGENGVDIKLRQLFLSKNEEFLMSAFFEGSIEKTSVTRDVFEDVTTDLSAIHAIKWSELRDDVDDFASSVLSEIKERMLMR